ncbi:SDR family NAD(P)-dependent oxidoreductase [Mycobacterium sp. CVI_P3]|uniref:SDR family NAD(P)-dependent oxidoreductase n=1 Tax=Mycobacterium pinniadriaticum TaxID=2994102 RepID=A0ABT3SF79_9MYCO|nr:SDR family oxidoreductase [Mycobacterium pinniadriaticum]MCX2931775.1 SDR family NAD(P)-dependent oxidoreductase [Mycobacterium pinniadriaticum]MCX2938150.1 SDR family NAD(P)-dependent oxidoreductase [Mycobacterium pinniadriaticum]
MSNTPKSSPSSNVSTSMAFPAVGWSGSCITSCRVNSRPGKESSMVQISERKVVVVGASRGIGRVVALYLARHGAHVALAGRSVELLAEAVAVYPDQCTTVGCDVRDPDSCDAAIEQAVAALGGLDALIYAAGVTHFGEMAQTTAEQWHTVFDTNIIGAAVVTRAALPHLGAAEGNAVYLSSHSVSQQPPWAGIGAYICSKTALERMVQCWQHENPEVAFTTLGVGPTVSTVRDRQPEGSRFGAIWAQRELINGRQLDGAEHAAMITHILSSPARFTSTTIVPR